jgi:hypothetical protein
MLIGIRGPFGIIGDISWNEFSSRAKAPPLTSTFQFLEPPTANDSDTESVVERIGRHVVL